MLRKLMICPYFGPLPSWYEHWEANVARLADAGYDFLIETDLPAFKQRVRDTLGIEAPIVSGEGKIHDYRCAFGEIFRNEIRGYDFFGHTDFDMVYGRVDRWVTDAFLDGLDLHSNHIDYVSGPWSLYRNVPEVRQLFRKHAHWRAILEDPTASGWVETGFTDVVDEAHERQEIHRVYTDWQAQNLNDFSRCRWDGDRLMEGDTEVMCAHFRRTKVYPPQLIR